MYIIAKLNVQIYQKNTKKNITFLLANERTIVGNPPQMKTKDVG